MEEHLSWASFCSDRGEWVFFNEEKRLSPFYLLASLARAGSLAGTLCRVREVPLFCTTTHIGFFRNPTTNSAVVGNAPHNLRRRSQVSRTRHRLRNGAARATAFWKEEVPVPHFFVKKDCKPLYAAQNCFYAICIGLSITPLWRAPTCG